MFSTPTNLQTMDFKAANLNLNRHMFCKCIKCTVVVEVFNSYLNSEQSIRNRFDLTVTQSTQDESAYAVPHSA